jgi:NADPH-dependent curcumin reductase CurA
VAGQIAKLKGCRVIGIAGGPQKCAWLTGDLGFDAAVDYKSPNFSVDLATALTKGVDVYFDNVGGEILEAIIPHLKQFARIVACGTLTDYNDIEPQPGPRGLQIATVVKRLRMEGFIVLDFAESWDKAEVELDSWIDAGLLKPSVDVREGFETLPRNLIGLFQGSNRGKLMVRVGAVDGSQDGGP